MSAVSQILNSENIITWNLDKHYLRDLADNGARIAPIHWMEKGEKNDIKYIMA